MAIIDLNPYKQRTGKQLLSLMIATPGSGLRIYLTPGPTLDKGVRNTGETDMYPLDRGKETGSIPLMAILDL